MSKLTREDQDRLINPTIQNVTIGKRKLREIEILPLSMADQLEFIESIAGTVSDFFALKDSENIKFVLLIKKALSENLGKVLKLITDEPVDSVMKDITNPQTVILFEVVYAMNFEIFEKKGTGLLKKAMTILGRQASLPQSSDTIQDLDLKTSSENLGEKEELQ